MIDYLLFIQCIRLCELMHDRFEHTVWLSREYVRRKGARWEDARASKYVEKLTRISNATSSTARRCVYSFARTILEAFVIGRGRNYIARRQIARICNKWCESWRTNAEPLGVNSLCLYKVWNKYRFYLTFYRTILKRCDILAWNKKRYINKFQFQSRKEMKSYTWDARFNIIILYIEVS